MLNRCHSNSSEQLCKEQFMSPHKWCSQVLSKSHTGLKRYGILLVPQDRPRLGEQRGLQGHDAFDTFELILFQMEFHVLRMVQHKVQAGVHNPHVSRRSHVGVGSTNMLFHWKIFK